MALNRREFLQGTGAATAAFGLTVGAPSLLSAAGFAPHHVARPGTPGDAVSRDLALLALDGAGSAGASYAVARVSHRNVRNVSTHVLGAHPTHWWLTSHESVAHPTELDRALGVEANHAGPAVVASPDRVLGCRTFGGDAWPGNLRWNESPIFMRFHLHQSWRRGLKP